jgi:hypothetical protein
VSARAHSCLPPLQPRGHGVAAPTPARPDDESNGGGGEEEGGKRRHRPGFGGDYGGARRAGGGRGAEGARSEETKELALQIGDGFAK